LSDTAVGERVMLTIELVVPPPPPPHPRDVVPIIGKKNKKLKSANCRM
jgi:hypothetical protein